MGSNPGTVYWMDVSDASYYITPKIMKIKVVEWGTPKKKIFKKLSLSGPILPNLIYPSSTLFIIQKNGSKVDFRNNSIWKIELFPHAKIKKVDLMYVMQ